MGHLAGDHQRAEPSSDQPHRETHAHHENLLQSERVKVNHLTAFCFVFPMKFITEEQSFFLFLSKNFYIQTMFQIIQRETNQQ